MKERRTYDKEFKILAIEMLNSGKTPKQVGLELDIAPDIIRRWLREFKQYNEGSFSGRGLPNMTPEQKEIARLKKELADAKLDAEILKKAISIFPCCRIILGAKNYEDVRPKLVKQLKLLHKNYLSHKYPISNKAGKLV